MGFADRGVEYGEDSSFIVQGNADRSLLSITITRIMVFEWGMLMVEPGYDLFVIGFDSHSHSIFLICLN